MQVNAQLQSQVDQLVRTLEVVEKDLDEKRETMAMLESRLQAKESELLNVKGEKSAVEEHSELRIQAMEADMTILQQRLATHEVRVECVGDLCILMYMYVYIVLMGCTGHVCSVCGRIKTLQR